MKNSVIYFRNILEIPPVNSMAYLGVHKMTLASSCGTLLLILGIFLGWFAFPYLFKRNLIQHLSLFPGSEAMTRWMDIPFPLEFKVYFFNVTNSDEVSQGERPIVQEVGPYVYDLYKTKVNVTYDKNTDTFIYFTKERYYFNAIKSYPNKEKDRLVLINVPLMGTATMVEKLFPMGLSFLNTAIPYLFPNITNIFLTATAKQFMFDGVLINCSYPTGPAMPICNGLRNRLPETIISVPDTKNFKFSLFRHKNDTAAGPFKIYGGNKDIFKLGQIIEYKSNTSLTMWDQNTTCSILKGTDSTIFPPISDLNSNIYIYIPDMCLSLSAVYTNTSMFRDITVYRYENSKENFADHISKPENICRCPKNEDSKKPPICLKEGAIDANNCQGVPVIFTQPHFLDADEEYRNYSIGLKPDRVKHLTYVIIEPKTGAPVIGKKRMQMNIFLHKVEDISLLANVSEGLFPISWVEEGGEINEASMKKLSEMYVIYHSLDTAKWIIICCGAALLVISSILYSKYKMLFCFDGNRVSQFSYGVNTFHVESKGSHQPKSSTFNPPNAREDVMQTISDKLNRETKINDNSSSSI